MRNLKKRVLWAKKYYPLERRKSRFFLFIIVWGTCLTLLCKHFLVESVVIEGVSMYPVFQHGQIFLANKYVYRLRSPKRGEIVCLQDHSQKGSTITKRVIALPGELIEIKEGNVLINGIIFNEPYSEGKTLPDMEPVTLGPDSYFVMGDNRMISEDSRHFGPISRRDITGKIQPDRLFPLW